MAKKESNKTPAEPQPAPKLGDMVKFRWVVPDGFLWKVIEAEVPMWAAKVVADKRSATQARDAVMLGLAETLYRPGRK